MNSYHPYAALTILFWSLAYVFTRLTLRCFSPLSLGFLRYLAASLALLILVLLRREKAPAARDIPWFLLCGAVGFFLYMIAFNTGTQTVTASTGSVVIAATPLITAVLARLFCRERLSPIQTAAIVLAFCGVVILTVLQGGFSVNLGLLYLIAAAVLLAVYNLLQRRLTKKYSPLQVTAYGIFAGTLMLAIFAPEAFRELRTAPPVQWLMVLALGFLSSAAAYCAWAKAFSLAATAASVSSYMFVTPFLTTLLALFIAAEPVQGSTVIGGLVILAGLFLLNFGDRLLGRRGRQK